MANSARRTIRYKPRMSEAEAYEALPLTLKRALQEAVTEWSSYWIYQNFERYGLAQTIDVLHEADAAFMSKKIKVKKAVISSSFVACKVRPLKAYGITRNTRLAVDQKGSSK
jgi:hypothetical protein